MRKLSRTLHRAAKACYHLAKNIAETFLNLIHRRILKPSLEKKFEYLTILLAIMSIALSCYFAYLAERSSNRMEIISKAILYSVNKEFADTIGVNVSDIEDPVLFAEMWIAFKSLDQTLLETKIHEYERKYPNNAHAYFILGWYARLNGSCDEAIQYYSKSIELNRDYAFAYNNRADAKDSKGDHDGAISDYNRAIEINPGYFVAFDNRGRAKFNKGDYEGAIIDFTIAIELNPNYSRAYNNRAGTKIKMGDLDGAIADYNRAIQLEPSYAIAYNNRGFTRQQKGDYDGAIIDYTIAIQLKSDFAKAYNNRGYAKYKKGDNAAAIADFSKSIELGNPEPWQPYCNRGFARLGGHDYTNAIADFSKAIELKPDFAPAFKGRATAKRKMGDKNAAQADSLQAERLEKMP